MWQRYNILCNCIYSWCYIPPSLPAGRMPLHTEITYITMFSLKKLLQWVIMAMLLWRPTLPIIGQSPSDNSSVSVPDYI